MFALILQPPLRGLDKARDRRPKSVTARRTRARVRSFPSAKCSPDGVDWSSIKRLSYDIGQTAFQATLFQ